MGISANRVGCIVLAAGRSERFGPTDKLAADFRGRPLLHHVLETLCAVGFAQKIVVCRPATPDISGLGYDRLEVGPTDSRQSDSLRAGIRTLHAYALDAFLIALGDMPAITEAHINRLLDQFDPDDLRCVIASASGETRGPPALFAAGLAGELASIAGDQGARTLLRRAVAVHAPSAELIDVDTPGDLGRAAEIP